MIRSPLIALSVVSLVLISPHARAQSAGMNLQQQAEMVWHQMRTCAQQAALKFRDHTPDGNAHREAARLDCLRRNHLPVTAEWPRYY
jgi:hypothetical protein